MAEAAGPARCRRQISSKDKPMRACTTLRVRALWPATNASDVALGAVVLLFGAVLAWPVYAIVGLIVHAG